MNSAISESLGWRYATKRFDREKKVSEHDIDELLEVLRLAPSSFGIQPWKFIVVKDPGLKKELRAASLDQAQIEEASHLIVFAVYKSLNELHVRKFMESTASIRNVPVESLKAYEDYILGFIKSLSQEQIFEWSAKQAYIALGFLLYACAQKRIDSCPMEGIVPEKYNEILSLNEQGLSAVVVCTIGYRSENDEYARAKKSRFGKSELFIFR